jgi:curved DNA-binding protein CbpA
MSRTHYELLDVPRTASRDEVKHAFRREIARYHPDKVQHLGPEFEAVAAVKAAELTEAYTTLLDPVLRERYDETLGGESAVGIDTPLEDAVPPVESAPGDDGQGHASPFADDRAGASDYIRRAIASRFRQGLEEHFGRCVPMDVEGFDLACIPRSGMFGAAPPRILVRYVTDVDGEAVVDAWRLAVRMRADIHRDVCLFLVGPGVAPPGELAVAIQEQRRKRMPGGAKLSLVPVNTRTWHAHIQTDAPPVVKALLALVKAA